MRARIRALMLAALLCVAAGACARDGITAPAADAARLNGAPAGAPQDGTVMPDTTDPGWGGYGGSGG